MLSSSDDRSPALIDNRSAAVQPATGLDRVRQVSVTVAEILCVVGTLVGVGLLGGTRVQESAGGALSAEATRIAPAGPAFSIWSVIYVGLAAYTVWQWLPSSVTERTRSTGWLAAVSMLLNAGWLLVTQQGWIWASVVVIVALALVLGELLRRLTRQPAGGVTERVVVDWTFGLYLGWVAVATCANVTAALVASGVRPSDAVSDTLAVVVLLVAAALGVVFARTLGGRWTVAIAMAWGLGWIAVGRASGNPPSLVVALFAAIAALVVLAVVPWARRASTRWVDAR
jgi:hypothetical protein